ncbi:MAG: alpha/beta hydrolase [Deltaproteobacteria bacterium]|nr:alpha/beta hydrolase [Deltaproteobacteria bacterium]
MSKRHVVMLHGLGRTKFSMSLLGQKISREGYHVLNWGYRSRSATIAQQARRLHERLMIVAGGGEELSFVTHSLGSIILRRFALEYGEHYNLKRAVMLGPPNQGSSFAARLKKLPLVPAILGSAYLELCALEMAPASDKLEIGIIAGGKGREKGYSPFIVGDNDGVVAVKETFLEGAKAHKTLPGLHSFLMYYPSIVDEVLHFLRCGRFKD